MTFHAPTLIQCLRELQQQITEAPRQAESLHAALDGQDVLDALCTGMDAERHVRAMAATAADIKAQVIASDGLGAKVESLSELVLRAVRVVVLADLSALADVVSEPCAGGRSPALALGPFEHVDDWRSYVAHAVNGITQGWICYRGMDGVERAAYRAELREAHAAMRQLGESSRVAPFLREAITRADWPSLQEVCSRISTALAVRIDADPDLPLMVVSQPPQDAAVRQAP